MKIDQVSCNFPQKTFCLVSRQAKQSQSLPDSSPYFPRASGINRELFRTNIIQTQARDLTLWGYEFGGKFGDAQSPRAADALMVEYRS